ncbi:MAG TPA: hypothetical protein VJT72_09470 [Pseudonocardiaceae bacterium]|nr:hypothetical protein [Pseudonocardiaceae bacterium]
MTELLHTVASWQGLLLIVLVFGFAPGFCLRLLVLAYPRNDPRRTELIAELYTVPRIQRPLWVAEQLETALFEGVPHRLAAVRQWATRPYRARAKVVGPVKIVSGEQAVKSYRCPGCNHKIRPGTAHIVARTSVADRQHWHTTCWSARARRH